nr:rho GTPase-activating protein 29-like [Penaeus vannamei]
MMEECGGGGGGGAGMTGVGPLDTSKEPEVLTQQQIDEYLYRHEQGVDHALHRAKVWSKYAKDVISYIEKRAQLDMEYSRNLTKLAHTIRPALKEESFLPFQSIYCTALDQDIENCTNLSATCTLLQTHKFIEPLTARRNDHEKARKVIKDTWHKELKKLTEAVNNLKKHKIIYDQRQQELAKAREAAARAENTESQDKIERKRDEAVFKAREAEATYRSCVAEANDRHASLLKVKRDVLMQTRELILQCDQTMKAVTVCYFQLQHTVAAPAPVQLQTLCESSRLYEPGSQYMEFVKRLGPSLGQETPETPFSFESYTPGQQDAPHDHATNGSVPGDDLQVGRLAGPGGSDTDSVGSSKSAKSADASPTASPLATARRPHTLSSGDELETDPDTADTHYLRGTRLQVMSKAAVTHAFRRLKTPSRCRECDSYVYFHGYECAECMLGCHKKCLETLAIQCGHKRLPRKMTTFGVDLAQHLSETNAPVPHLVLKCIAEIDAHGIKTKGIYRVSGVKSRVEKLCQAFENGAHLVDLTDQHANVIANVLKLYLRQLPEPLLTFRLYPDFIRIAKEAPVTAGTEAGRTIEELRELVRRLPRHHLNCLTVLMHHLHRVSSFPHLNNMPSSNLGIVFGPTLLRTSEGSASLSSLVDTVHQTRAIELLITYAHEIFPQSEILQSRDLQVPSGASSARARIDEVLKQPLPSRQTSVHTSSSSSSSSINKLETRPVPREQRGGREDKRTVPNSGMKDRRDYTRDHQRDFSQRESGRSGMGRDRDHRLGRDSNTRTGKENRPVPSRQWKEEKVDADGWITKGPRESRAHREMNREQRERQESREVRAQHLVNGDSSPPPSPKPQKTDPKACNEEVSVDESKQTAQPLNNNDGVRIIAPNSFTSHLNIPKNKCSL